MIRNSRNTTAPAIPPAESPSTESSATTDAGDSVAEEMAVDNDPAATDPPPPITPQWQYWTPGPASGVDVAWALVASRRFSVRLYYAVAGSTGPSDGEEFASSLIVDTTLGPDQTEVPFSVFESIDVRPFLSGSFDYVPPAQTGEGTLTLRRLSFPGGAVEDHIFYTDPVR